MFHAFAHRPSDRVRDLRSELAVVVSCAWNAIGRAKPYSCLWRGAEEAKGTVFYLRGALIDHWLGLADLRASKIKSTGGRY